MVREEDVSSAWDFWSSAAETALADASRFAGGPLPDRGLVVSRGTARCNMDRDSSIALLLDLRRLWLMCLVV